MVTSIFPRSYAWIVPLIAADVFISIGMMYYLVYVPRRGAIAHQNSSNKFMAIARRSIETNLITLVIQVVFVVIMLTGAGGLWFMLLDKITVKSYLFALLTSLNARETDQGIGQGIVSKDALDAPKRRIRKDLDLNISVVGDDVPLDDYNDTRVPMPPVALEFVGPRATTTSTKITDQSQSPQRSGGTGTMQDHDAKNVTWGHNPSF
ncbi:hypothetical protein RQP46_008769 [Phenoliferia psychrophenolica]